MSARRLLPALLGLAVISGLIMAPGGPPAHAQERPYDLSLRLYGVDRDEALAAGEESLFSLELVNHGSRPITGLRLSAEAPQGWAVTLNPDAIAHLPQGSLRSVDVRIVPPEKVSRREHTLTFRAEGDGITRTHRAHLTVRSAKWLWIGGLVVAAAVAAFVAIFVTQRKSDPVIDLDDSVVDTDPGRTS